MKARRLRGEAFSSQGRLEEAESELTAALGLAHELGNPAQLWKTRAALGQLLTAQGKLDQTRRTSQEALSLIERVAQRLHDKRLRKMLLTSADVKAIQRCAGRQPG